MIPGNKYSLALQVTDSASGRIGKAFVSFSVPAIPTGGSIFVSPISGTEASTVFTVSMKNWNIPAGSLTVSYSFSYLYNGQEIVFATPSLVDTATTRLPAGASITVLGYAYSQYGSYSTVSTTVQVTPMTASPSAVSTITQQAASSNNVNEVVQLAIIPAAVNQRVTPDCSCSGHGTCDASNTCVCSTGYYGSLCAYTQADVTANNAAQVSILTTVVSSSSVSLATKVQVVSL